MVFCTGHDTTSAKIVSFIKTQGIPSGCGLDCQKKLFGTWLVAQRDFVSDRDRLFTAELQKVKRLRPPPRPSLSQRDVSFNLERVLDCGCVKVEETGHLLFYG